jgi:probable DNA metabolism protein
MRPIIYDGSFDGLLTAVFEIYDRKIVDANIIPQRLETTSLFGGNIDIKTDKEKSSRVWKGLEQKLSHRARLQLYKTFLSEINGIENVVYRYIRYAFATRYRIESDLANADVNMVQQTSKKVHREKHRMEAFVRFQQLKDGLYYALVQPDYNVLPLISRHFEDRYADQRWLIYDSQRKYGIYYNLETVEEVQLLFSDQAPDGAPITALYDEKEDLYQRLWQQYFSSVNIAARKNTKLHLQHMPKRYWKNLVEKKG